MKRTPLVIMAALIVAMAAGVQAQQDQDRNRRDDADERGFGRGGMSRFLPLNAALDADGDGEISTKEIEGAVAALKGLDKDKNGKLTEDELRPNFGGDRDEQGRGTAGGRGFDPEAMVARMMEQDKNKDGKLAKDEVSERMQGMIERADRDNDGVASKDELAASFRRPMGGFGGGQAGGQAGGRGGFGGPQNAERFVDRALEFDADKDGKLSKEELTKWAEQMGRGFGGARGGEDRPQRPQRPERGSDNN